MRRVAPLLFFCLLLVGLTQAQVPANPIPVNPHASPEARALLKYLYSISGKYILSGQHNYPNHIARWTDRAYDLTGKYPVVFGQDFGFSGGDDKDSTEARPSLVAEVERQWRNGAIPTLTWHAVRPTNDEPVTFHNSVQGHLSDFEWNELLTPGTDLYNRWSFQVDVIAGYLTQLRDAHVPVLLRPYHEMNGNWFWWGGRPGKNGSAALYRQLFDRFVNYHHLDNLVWVWNVNTPGGNSGPFADYFPGSDYADVLSVDNYGEFKTEYYNDVLALAGGKLVALGEVGAVPPVDVLKAQPKWTWFMVWSEFVEMASPLGKLQAVYSAPSTLTRDDPRVAVPLAAIRKASPPAKPQAVAPDASRETVSLLERLSQVASPAVLAGQENEPSTPAASTAQVSQITAKYPAIFGEDLGITKEAALEVEAGRQGIVEEAKRQNQSHAIVSLTWHAARPTDDEPGSQKESVSGQLSDFEWNQLLTPNTRLYQRWAAQVDSMAKSLQQLQQAGVAVLWHPYPESNTRKYWWGGRKGIRGSSALYRQLFERLQQDGLRNLVWVWDAAPLSFGPDEGAYSDFFPGPAYVDALQLNVEDLNSLRFGGSLRVLCLGKPIGVRFAGKLPPSDVFEANSPWSWFMNASFSSDPSKLTEQSEAARKLYQAPQVAGR